VEGSGSDLEGKHGLLVFGLGSGLSSTTDRVHDQHERDAQERHDQRRSEHDEVPVESLIRGPVNRFDHSLEVNFVGFQHLGHFLLIPDVHQLVFNLVVVGGVPDDANHHTALSNGGLAIKAVDSGHQILGNDRGREFLELRHWTRLSVSSMLSVFSATMATMATIMSFFGVSSSLFLVLVLFLWGSGFHVVGLVGSAVVRSVMG